jgi:hypothetical protein
VQRGLRHSASYAFALLLTLTAFPPLTLCGLRAERDYEVHILVDGVSSTRPIDRTTALQRLTQHGAFMSSSEMALFQLMRSSKSPHFKVRHAPAVCCHATSSHCGLLLTTVGDFSDRR